MGCLELFNVVGWLVGLALMEVCLVLFFLDHLELFSIVGCLVRSALTEVRDLGRRWWHLGGGTRASGWHNADAGLFEHKFSPVM